MGKQVNLTAAGIESRVKKGIGKFYSDAGQRGLYLKTTVSCTGSWVFRWRDRVTGKLRDMGLGTVAEISLAEARELAGELRKEVRGGGDPLAERARKRQERISEAVKAQTFQQVAESYYAARIETTGYSDKHKKRWKSMMALHVYPKIGGVPVAAIELAHVESVLAPIWKDQLDMARKIRQNIEKVMGFAITGKLHPGPNPAVWRGVLDTRLADTRGIRKEKPVQHHKAVPWQEMHGFITDLRQRDGMAARAVEFAVLTAARSSEVRFMTWDEVDLDGKLWTIPETRYKTGKAHRIPLSDRAVELLSALPRREDSPFVFPAVKGGALSDMAMTAVLRRMEVDATVHGTCRSSFKDWARSSTSYADEVSELALGHVNSDSTRAAYARDELIPQRVKLMAAWAKYLDTAPDAKGEVVSIGTAAKAS